MKIAQIAPLAKGCPPKLYGGTERIVSYLTEELVRLGHDVGSAPNVPVARRARTRKMNVTSEKSRKRCWRPQTRRFNEASAVHRGT
jgi:hypothetical protein